MLSVISPRDEKKHIPAAKTVYSNDTLLRLRTSPHVATVAPDVNLLPVSCRNIIVTAPSTSITGSTHQQDPSCVAPVINAAVTVVRHEKKTKNGVTADGGNSPDDLSVLRSDKGPSICIPKQPMPKLGFLSFSTRPDYDTHIAMIAQDREKLLSIRQSFSTRAMGPSRTTSPIINPSSAPIMQRKEPASHTGEPSLSSVITQGPAAPSDDPPVGSKKQHACPWSKDGVSAASKTRDEDIFLTAPISNSGRAKVTGAKRSMYTAASRGHSPADQHPKTEPEEVTLISAAHTSGVSVLNPRAKGWIVSGGTGDVNLSTAANFYQEIPSAPISRSERRQLAAQRQESTQGKSEEQKVSRRQKAKSIAREHSQPTPAVPRNPNSLTGSKLTDTNAAVNHGSSRTTAVAVQGSAPSGNMYEMMSQSRDMPMDPTEWYQWWMGQVSSPAVTLVPVEVPVDEHGRVLDDGMSMNAALRSRMVPTEGEHSVVTGGKHGSTKNQISAASPQKASQAAPPTAEGDMCEFEQKKSKARGRRGGVKHRKKLERRNEREEGHVIQATGMVIDTKESQESYDDILVQTGKTNPKCLNVKRPEHCNPKPLEDDAFDRRVVQRERQVRLGKRTLGFRVIECLQERMEPVNPDAFHPKVKQHCSKRSWDGQMRRWRQILHTYDDRAHEVLSKEEIAALPIRSTNADEEDYTVFGDADIREANVRFGEYVANIGCQDFANVAAPVPSRTAVTSQ